MVAVASLATTDAVQATEPGHGHAAIPLLTLPLAFRKRKRGMPNLAWPSMVPALLFLFISCPTSIML